PKMAQTSLDQRRLARCVVQPVQESTDFKLEATSGRCLEMPPLAADGARHYLHLCWHKLFAATNTAIRHVVRRILTNARPNPANSAARLWWFGPRRRFADRRPWHRATSTA